MALDFTKFPFPGIRNPNAPTLTEAIKSEAVSAGFVVLAIKPASQAILPGRSAHLLSRSVPARTGSALPT